MVQKNIDNLDKNSNLLNQNKFTVAKTENNAVNPQVIKSAKNIISKHKYAFKVLAND